MYLDEFHYQCKFSDILNANIGNGNTLTMDCPKCKMEINIKDEKKYIKLPDILIFTLERYQGPTNNVSIIPDELLDVRDYTDKSVFNESYIYVLFAINIRFRSTANFGHEICQVKRNGKWYEILFLWIILQKQVLYSKIKDIKKNENIIDDKSRANIKTKKNIYNNIKFVKFIFTNY